MSPTSHIVKEMHVHKPMIQMLMCYTGKDNKRVAHMIRIGDARAESLVLRTLRWAAHNGVEVVFRPA